MCVRASFSDLTRPYLKLFSPRLTFLIRVAHRGKEKKKGERGEKGERGGEERDFGTANHAGVSVVAALALSL